MSIWPKFRHYGWGPFLRVAQHVERDMEASFHLIYLGVTNQLRNLPSERMVTDLGFMTQLLEFYGKYITRQLRMYYTISVRNFTTQHVT